MPITDSKNNKPKTREKNNHISPATLFKGLFGKNLSAQTVEDIRLFQHKLLSVYQQLLKLEPKTDDDRKLHALVRDAKPLITFLSNKDLPKDLHDFVTKNSLVTSLKVYPDAIFKQIEEAKQGYRPYWYTEKKPTAPQKRCYDPSDEEVDQLRSALLAELDPNLSIQSKDSTLKAYIKSYKANTSKGNYDEKLANSILNQITRHVKKTLNTVATSASQDQKDNKKHSEDVSTILAEMSSQGSTAISRIVNEHPIFEDQATQHLDKLRTLLSGQNHKNDDSKSIAPYLNAYIDDLTSGDYDSHLSEVIRKHQQTIIDKEYAALYPDAKAGNEDVDAIFPNALIAQSIYRVFGKDKSDDKPSNTLKLSPQRTYLSYMPLIGGVLNNVFSTLFTQLGHVIGLRPHNTITSLTIDLISYAMFQSRNDSAGENEQQLIPFLFEKFPEHINSLQESTFINEMNAPSTEYTTHFLMIIQHAMQSLLSESQRKSDNTRNTTILSTRDDKEANNPRIVVKNLAHHDKKEGSNQNRVIPGHPDKIRMYPISFIPNEISLTDNNLLNIVSKFISEIPDRLTAGFVKSISLIPNQAENPTLHLRNYFNAVFFPLLEQSIATNLEQANRMHIRSFHQHVASTLTSNLFRIKERAIDSANADEQHHPQIKAKLIDVSEQLAAMLDGLPIQSVLTNLANKNDQSIVTAYTSRLERIITKMNALYDSIQDKTDEVTAPVRESMLDEKHNSPARTPAHTENRHYSASEKLKEIQSIIDLIQSTTHANHRLAPLSPSLTTTHDNSQDDKKSHRHTERSLDPTVLLLMQAYQRRSLDAKSLHQSYSHFYAFKQALDQTIMSLSDDDGSADQKRRPNKQLDVGKTYHALVQHIKTNHYKKAIDALDGKLQDMIDSIRGHLHDTANYDCNDENVVNNNRVLQSLLSQLAIFKQKSMDAYCDMIVTCSGEPKLRKDAQALFLQQAHTAFREVIVIAEQLDDKSNGLCTFLWNIYKCVMRFFGQVFNTSTSLYLQNGRMLNRYQLDNIADYRCPIFHLPFSSDEKGSSKTTLLSKLINGRVDEKSQLKDCSREISRVWLEQVEMLNTAMLPEINALRTMVANNNTHMFPVAKFMHQLHTKIEDSKIHDVDAHAIPTPKLNALGVDFIYKFCEQLFKQSSQEDAKESTAISSLRSTLEQLSISLNSLSDEKSEDSKQNSSKLATQAVTDSIVSLFDCLKRSAGLLAKYYTLNVAIDHDIVNINQYYHCVDEPRYVQFEPDVVTKYKDNISGLRQDLMACCVASFTGNRSILKKYDPKTYVLGTPPLKLRTNAISDAYGFGAAIWTSVHHVQTIIPGQVETDRLVVANKKNNSSVSAPTPPAPPTTPTTPTRPATPGLSAG